MAAIYWFARTADDMADEGDVPPEKRLADLAAYRTDLDACFLGQPGSGRWSNVFSPLGTAIADHQLPLAPLCDLLSAFEQDVAKTRDRAGYATRAELLDYCRRSANPVGRLMLHLYGVDSAQTHARSDAICTALQLINFWQDVGVDHAGGRHYFPADDLRAHGMDPALAATWPTHPNAPRLIADCAGWARGLMKEGAPLVHQIPGRAGWELRLVVQGGLRILDKTAAGGFNTFAARPRLRPWDAPVLLWRALWM